jgi:hypothetical protein
MRLLASHIQRGRFRHLGKVLDALKADAQSGLAAANLRTGPFPDD